MKQRSCSWRLSTVVVVIATFTSAGCDGSGDLGLNHHARPDGTAPAPRPGMPTVEEGCLTAPTAMAETRRLNVAELTNAVMDVFGVPSPEYDLLPPDGSLGGFTTAADPLAVSPLFTERYLDASERLAERIVDDRHLDVACAVDAASPLTEACVREAISVPAQRLFRGDLDDDELSRLASLAISVSTRPGMTPRDGWIAAVFALLTSPRFLYVTYEDPALTNAAWLSSRELATRLALVVWQSLPDDALLEAAAAGDLQTVEGRKAAVQSLLADPRAARGMDAFVSQWLAFENLQNIQPDTATWSGTSESWAALRDRMQDETLAFIRDVLESRAPVDTLLTGRFTYVDEALAAHYGLPAPTGTGLQRVTLPPDSMRMGLLTQGTFLAQTSLGDRTSIVKRGAAVLDGFLCDSPPPPPPALEDAINELLNSATSEEDAMNKRAASAACASCHAVMDPVGWAMENYDPLGRIRTVDEHGAPLAPHGEVFGVPYVGPDEMITTVAAQEKLASCLTEKLLIYGVGRPFSAKFDTADRCVVASVLPSTASTPLSFAELYERLLTSDAFASRLLTP